MKGDSLASWVSTSTVRNLFTRVRSIRLAAILISLIPSLTSAQTNSVRSRITAAIDERDLIVLRGDTHPSALQEFDRGPAPLNIPLNRMLLLLRRSAEQEASLEALLEQQQFKSSPSYRAWLTPEQFGRQFGPSDQDIQIITSWLQSHGFQVNRVANGRVTIEFSGTAGQLKQAFHTEIHRYGIGDKEYWANSTDPEIPSALAPVIVGIASLHNFPRKPLHRIAGVFSRPKGTSIYHPLRPQLAGVPLFNGGENCGLLGGSCYALAPYDFATIYNILPLWNATAPIDGTGQTIAIVGQSDIYLQDVTDFRSGFGLPAPNLNIINNGPDPGKLATEGDELESDLDVEWSGAIAKGAIIDFVVSASTNSTAGVDLSAEYIVDNNVAPILSESYGACELDLGTAGNEFYNQLWQQAAAQGITVFVATGDSGASVCDRGAATVTDGLSVNGIASTPYNVAVGGTDFNDLQNPTMYWNSTNNPVTQASAKGYIPEMTWNDSCTNSEFFQLTGDVGAENDCNDNSSVYWPAFLAPVGGSGGTSNCTTSTNQSVSSCAGGYAKPSWQTGTGVPNDGKRDLPDLSMFAGDGLNAHFYVVCETDIYGGCPNNEVFNVVGIGGTSAPTPALAGIMALVNQKTQSRQGNANFVFYPLAAQPGASCSSAGTTGSSCIFYDVTTGTIAMSCQTASPNCVTNVTGHQEGVLSGYSTAAGYDLATGLGSINVSALVNNWSSVSFEPTVSTLSLSPTTQITHGSPVNVNITVGPKTGMGMPTGLVSLLTSVGPGAGVFTLANASAVATTRLLPGGSYTVTAHYAGDGTFAASDSSPGISMTVSPEASTTTVQAFTIDQNGNAVPFASGPYGSNVVYLRADVAGQSGQGIPTGTVNLTEMLNGVTTNLAGDPFPLNSDGYTMTPLPGGFYRFFTPGTYFIGASYGGDISFNLNTSSTISFTIAKAQTSAAASITGCIAENGPCITNLGSPIVISATVMSSSSVFSSQPSGTMTFYSNGTQLGAPVAVDSSIIPPVASLPTNQLPIGQNSVTAQYSGDANYTGSTSPATSVDIVVGTTLGLTASSNSIQPGQSVTFTAQVMQTQTGGPTATGTVQFAISGVNVGSPVTVSGGVAQFTSTSLPVGSDQVVATYSGDANYRGSSASITETVSSAAPTFTIVANPTTVIVKASGQSGTSELVITAKNGFSSNGTAMISPVCSGLPPETGCSLASFNLPTNGATTAALYFLTTAPSGAVRTSHGHWNFDAWWNGSNEIVLAIFLFLAVTVLRLAGSHRRWGALLTLLAIAFLIGNGACGGGSGSGGGGGGGNQGTPSGNYPGISVTLTINGVTQTIQNLTVEVGH